MQNVVPAQTLSRRSRNLLYGAIAVFLFGVVSIAVSVVLSSIPIVVPSNPSYPTYVAIREALVVVGGILIVIAGAMALRAVTWRQDNVYAQTIGDALAEFLDKQYVYIRNVSKRNIGYVDAVLVGPPGVLVLRISTRKGIFYNEGTKWMTQKDKGSWTAVTWSPSEEAIADIQKIRTFLTEKGIEKPQVFGAVVFMDVAPNTIVTTSNATVPVAQLNELQDKLESNYFSKRDRIDIATVTTIAKLIYE